MHRHTNKTDRCTDTQTKQTDAQTHKQNRSDAQPHKQNGHTGTQTDKL